MRRFGVTVRAYNEFWLYRTYDDKGDAEEIRRVLEAQMPGAKIEVMNLTDNYQVSPAYALGVAKKKFEKGG